LELLEIFQTYKGYRKKIRDAGQLPT